MLFQNSCVVPLGITAICSFFSFVAPLPQPKGIAAITPMTSQRSATRIPISLCDLENGCS
jgi:hypothetical protein